MAATRPLSLGKFLRGLAPSGIVLAVLVGWLLYALYSRVHFWQEADEYNLKEWLNESRVFRKTLPELVREYLALYAGLKAQQAEGPQAPPTDFSALHTKAEEIQEQLKTLGNPTKLYQGQLPLFPEVFRIEIRFPAGQDPPLPPIAWDSHAPRPRNQGQGQGRLRSLEYRLLGDDDPRAVLRLEYQLHAYNKMQQDEQERQAVTAAVGVLALAAAILAVSWVYFYLKRERERELEQLRAQQQVERAEKLALENQLHREEAERKQEEMDRKLLEQRLEAARQESRAAAAERQALELKSQLYASIGIMAGSYAHNIKNLLVRPNDLISRCLEVDGLSGDQDQMLREVRQTLGTVTERLQQILRTVRRDPSRSEMTRLDLNGLVRDIRHTWEELARDKWKLALSVELCPEPLWIDGDPSHLQQAVENLLFNARDATFEMRNRLRDQARRSTDLDPQAKRQALIDAAAWRGQVALRTRTEREGVVLEVQDNGIGMPEDVRRRCTETHFSTKRDNALYEGLNAGMGLGLSFVVVILEHHRATFQVESEPLAGARFRVTFPARAEVPQAATAPGRDGRGS